MPCLRHENPTRRIQDAAARAAAATDPHLARRIGEAVNDAWRGELTYHYNKEENLLRVSWRR
jgi:hypothetical protein